VGISDSLKKGTIELLILKILTLNDMYGYQMCQEIENRSGERVTVLEGSLYPILYRLVERGFVTDRQELVGKRRFRIYYHITELGVQRGRELLDEYNQLNEEIKLIMKSVEEEKQ
jgi:Predicted transcriptional regulators